MRGTRVVKGTRVAKGVEDVGGGRLVLGAVGIAVAAYGGWLLWSRRDLADLFSALRWLVGGVLAHDLLLAPLVVLVAVVVGRLLPRVVHGPLAFGLVVLGTVTVMAVPVLGAWGRQQDPYNQTLLDRDYTAGWLLLAGLVALGVLVGTVWRARRSRSSGR